MLSDNHNKQNVGTAKYRRRNEVEDKTEYKPYVSKHTFKRREKKTLRQRCAEVCKQDMVESNNHNFKIVRQIKDSKPTKTICNIGNQTYMFT